MKKILQTLCDKADLYKPKPFLTLNDTIGEESLRRTIRTMAEHGIGGFYAHARSGLTIPYLSEEWFRITDICADECEKNGMQFWVYDEMGWPSGSAGGQVTAKNAGYAARWLELTESLSQVNGRLIACYDGAEKPCGEAEAKYYLCEVTNSGYIDVLNADAVRAFIDCTYEKYRVRYGSRVVGFFTDEPQYGMLHMPYTPAAEAAMAENGEDIREFGISLFRETGDYKRIRGMYFKTIGALFLRNYIGQISRWCERYGYRLTGHMLEEKSLEKQIFSCGDLLSVYSMMQNPGMDWLGRDMGANALAPRQILSVCKQFGKKANTSESYACVGYGASVQELKAIADWQIGNGITNLCYIIPYSARGRRKRDYPSGIVTFQPYFGILDDYNLYLSRFCALVAESDSPAEVLVVSPLPQAEEIFAPWKENAYSEALDEAVGVLERNHISYHVTNANILRGYGKTEGGKLRLGECCYSAAVCFSGDKSEVLQQFGKEGGTVLVADRDSRWAEPLLKFRDCTVIGADDASLRTSRFLLCGEEIVWVQNVSQTRVRFSLKNRQGGSARLLDILSLTESGGTEYCLAPGESALFTFGVPLPAGEASLLSLSDVGWDIRLADRNALLIDRVDCYKNGKLYAEGVAPILLQEKLVRDGDDCSLELIYRAHSEIPLRGACLGVEDAERYEISVNGIAVPSRGMSIPFVTDCITRVPLPDLPAGDLEISLRFRFAIPAEVRRVLLGENAIESDFNRLQDLPEVENICLIGDFSVRGVRQEEDMLVSDGRFLLEEYVAPTQLSAFGRQGLPFYTGEIAAKKEFFLRKGGKRYEFACGLHGAAVRVFINGRLAGDVLWNRRLDVTELLVDGKNEIELRLYNNLRNLFGPHHNKLKDPHMVGFTTFADEPGWCDPPQRLWTDTCYLKEYGIDFPKVDDENQSEARKFGFGRGTVEKSAVYAHKS